MNLIEAKRYMEAKLKVKTESPPERCEICHQSDCFDRWTGYCSRCAVVYQKVQGYNFEHLKLPRPSSVTIYDEGERLILIQRWFNTIKRKRFYSLSVLLYLTFIYFSLTYFGFGSSAYFIFTFFYRLVTTFVNRTTIEITKNELLIKNGPLVWPWDPSEIRLQRDDIKEIYCKEIYQGNNSLYVLIAVTKKDNINLSTQNEPEVAIFIKQQIEAKLGIMSKSNEIDKSLRRDSIWDKPITDLIHSVLKLSKKEEEKTTKAQRTQRFFI